MQINSKTKIFIVAAKVSYKYTSFLFYAKGLEPVLPPVSRRRPDWESSTLKLTYERTSAISQLAEATIFVIVQLF